MRPVSASNSSTPTPYQSLAVVGASPAACSGEMYDGVPGYAVVGHRLARAADLGVCDEAEVQDHDAIAVRDQHVARLEVAVQLAGRVDGAHARG